MSESYTNLLPFEPLVLIITIHGGNRKRFWLYDSKTTSVNRSVSVFERSSAEVEVDFPRFGFGIG